MLFLALVDFITAPLFLMVEAMPEWNLGFPLPDPVNTVHVPSWFPLGVFVLVATTSVVWNLGLLIFTLAEWVYRHIPNVFGTGPGGG